MNLQYISDSKGQTTGVFIPINEWNELKNKYKGIEEEEMEISSWQLNLVKERLEKYHKNPDSALDFDSTMDDIDNKL